MGAARDTATNPAVLDAVALVICEAEGPPSYPGIAGREADLPAARGQAAAIGRPMSEVRTLLPDAASSVSESDFFERNWQRAYWGPTVRRSTGGALTWGRT